MPDFEGERLEIYEEYIDNLEDKTDLSHGDYIFPSFTKTVAVDDGYREADYILELTISNEREKEIVLMASGIYDDDRKILKDVEEEEPFTRARKYAAELEKGAYYGITDGEKVRISALDPDIKLEDVKKIDKLHEIINEIIKEERKIKRSKDFISKLNEYNENINPNVHSHLREKIEEDDSFEEEIRDFLTPIGKSYEEDENIPEETLEMLSRQATYLLVDKILFYHLILENEENLKEGLEERKKYDKIFEELKEEPPKPGDDIEKWAEEFWDYLNRVFELIREINYEPIFDPEKSPLNKLNLKEHPSACFEIKDLMDFLWKKEGLSNLFDGPLLAKIYEGLIPPELRWKWGQIYTPPEVTRLIAEWAIRDPNDKVLDPACGTGRFLVSAYEKIADLKDVEIGEKHQEIINQLHGIDINQFPAHLATMSLVAMSLNSVTEEININIKDFFRYVRGTQANLGVTEDKVKTKKKSAKAKDFERPIGEMDSIIMNPPYTRQEALEDKYKNQVREASLSNINGKNSVEISNKTGYYTYFMTHGTKFLKNNGRFGMIIQNSWLDVNYGKDIQKFLLDNYKIKSVIGTKKDRLIKTADVNTVVVLLEREENKKKRLNNKVKFVRLERNLEWFEENYGFKNILDIIDQNEQHYGADFRIVTKTQEELINEGMGATTYTGGKWGKYIRAPDIYFEIINNSENNFTRLQEHSLETYLNTGGANKFFFVKEIERYSDGTSLILNQEYEEEFIIESEFLKPLIKSPQQLHSLKITKDDIDNLYVLVVPPDIDLESTKVEEYIRFGKEKGYNERSGRKNKNPWWKPPKRATYGSNILLPRTHNENHLIYYNPEKFISDRFYRANSGSARELVLALNSTVTALFLEVLGNVNLGQGALEVYKSDYNIIPVINGLSKLKVISDDIEIMERKSKSILKEIGAETPEEVSIDKVMDDRRKLDKIIMEDILGLSKREQLEVYRGVVELVKNRLEKADSSD